MTVEDFYRLPLGTRVRYRDGTIGGVVIWSSSEGAVQWPDGFTVVPRHEKSNEWLSDLERAD